MSFPKGVWDQLKNKTADELISALNRDGWDRDEGVGAIRLYYKSGRRVSIHYHPKKTFGPKLLQGLLEDIGWTEEDLTRLKLIK